MTLVTTHSAPAPARNGNAGQSDILDHRQRSAEFERLLREKTAAHDDDHADDDTEAVPDGSAAMLPAWVAGLLPRSSHGDSDAGGCTRDGDGTAVAARRGARADVPDPAQPLAPPADAADAWEVSLRQPLGVAVDVRATRTADAINGWSLAIGSPTLDAAVLARHAPRLNERLKNRALSNSHARIEGSDPQDKK